MSDYKNILNLPMGPNAADALTIGQYLVKLLLKLWEEGESFSGKRPFGNSGWEYELYQPLIDADLVSFEVNDYGEISTLDRDEADRIIRKAIESLL